MRVLNRPLAFLLAAALLAASVILVVEVVAVAVGANPVTVAWDSWYRWAERTTWKADVVRFWSIVLIVVGLLLLVIELKPRRDNRIRIAADHGATDAAITRRGLKGAVTSAATSVDGVLNARVRASKRRVTVSARTRAHGAPVAGSLEAPIRTAVQQKLDSLQLTPPPKLVVTTVTRSG